MTVSRNTASTFGLIFRAALGDPSARHQFQALAVEHLGAESVIPEAAIAAVEGSILDDKAFQASVAAGIAGDGPPRSACAPTAPGPSSYESVVIAAVLDVDRRVA